MKSRTSFFNGVAFKKDVQRFAPVWALFTVLLLMGLVPIASEDNHYYLADGIASMTGVSAILAFLYAPLVAQLLFGDLYNARMCNALHAMPLRRESWFGTHVIAGLAFAWVPYAAVSLLALLVTDLGIAWTVVPLWLLASGAQYLFFFALSAFCCMIVGNRFSQIIIYCIFNFFALLVFWFTDSLYEPLLLGIRFEQEPFNLFAPVVQLVNNYDMIIVEKERLLDIHGDFQEYKVLGVALGEGWGYLSVCVVIGLALLVLSLILYRKRKLECAGDFIAFRFLEPVFLVFFTFSAGGFCQLFSQMFGIYIRGYLFLGVGLVVGFFVGRMLLMRTTRVFQPKAFLGLGVLAGVFALSLLLTAIDPIGFTRRVPEADEVASVYLSNRYGPTHYNYASQQLTVTDPSDIEKLIEAHNGAISGDSDTEGDGAGIYTVTFSVEYTLTDGSGFARFYEIKGGSPTADILEDFYTRFEYVMGFPEEDIPEMAKRVFNIYADDMWDSEQDISDYDVEGLLRAIAADCEAGNMAQFHAYHLGPGDAEGNPVILRESYLELGFDNERRDEGVGFAENVGTIEYRSFYVYNTCVNTLRWMEENGLPRQPLG